MGAGIGGEGGEGHVQEEGGLLHTPHTGGFGFPQALEPGDSNPSLAPPTRVNWNPSPPARIS